MDKVKSIKFVFEGQESKIKLVYRGRTTIATIIIGKEDMTYKDRHKRVYAGVSTCHPNDTYDVTEGIKQACRSALGISACNERHCQWEYDIYREIRKTLNPKIQTTDLRVTLNAVFEE